MDKFLTLGSGMSVDTENEKIDVDRISFSSIHQDDSLDAYMNAVCATEQTCSSNNSFVDLSMDGCMLVEGPSPLHSTPQPDEKIQVRTLTTAFPYNSDLPFWKESQRRILSLRHEDDSYSDYEKENQMIYVADLISSMASEALWRNEICSDPEIMEALSKVDPSFPGSLLTGFSHDSSSATITTPDDVDHTQSRMIDNGTFYVDHRKKSVQCVKSTTEGVDEVVVKKEAESTPIEMAVEILSVLEKRDPIRDVNVKKWIDDVVSGNDKLLDPHFFGSLCNEDGSQQSVQDKWIFNLHQQKTSKQLLEEQEYHCADCLAKIGKEYAKRVRYCDYYGMVFCQCCHQGAKTRIPARILHLWNFKEYPVCDRALAFLQQTRDQPAIHIRSVAPRLVEKIRILRTTIQLRQKLTHMWSYIQMCSSAENIVTRCGILRTMFTSLEKHLLGEADVFSLSDLERVYNGDLPTHLEPIVQFGKLHIEKCEICQAQAFMCSLCGNESDLLFPFQMERVARCEGCGSLSHLKCDAKMRKLNQTCPKCVRMEVARQRRKFVIACDD